MTDVEMTRWLDYCIREFCCPLCGKQLPKDNVAAEAAAEAEFREHYPAGTKKSPPICIRCWDARVEPLRKAGVIP